MSNARSPRLVCSTTIGTSRLSCKSIGSRSRIISRSLRTCVLPAKSGGQIPPRAGRKHQVLERLSVVLLQLLGELLGADLALGDLGRIKDVVYDLVFVKWRPEPGQRIGIALEELDHL